MHPRNDRALNTNTITMLSMLAMQYHLQVWFNSGLWHVPGQPAWYVWYTAFLTIVVYINFPMIITIQLFYTTNVEEFIDILFFWPTAAFGIKAALISINRPKIQRLFDLLKQMDEFVRLDAHRQMILVQNRESHHLVWFLSIEYYGSITIHILTALLSSGPVLMWSAWVPLDYENNYLVYFLFNMYEFTSTMMSGYVLTSLDMYGVALYKLLGAHLDILSKQLAALGNNGIGDIQREATTGLRRPKQLKKGAAATRTEWQRSNERKLHACVRYHMLCSEFSELLNTVISLQYFMQFGMSISVMCGSEFKLMMLDPMEDPFAYLTVVVYVLGLVFEIFLPCYIGSIVLAKSQQLLPAVYESNWIEQSVEYKTSLLIFGERAKRPIAPMAGGLFALELRTFLSVSVLG